MAAGKSGEASTSSETARPGGTRAWSLIGLCLLAIACGGDDGADPVELCNVASERDCALAFECFSDEMRAMRGYPSTEEQCVETRKAFSMCPAATGPGICQAEPGTTYNASAAGGCVDEWNSATCTTYSTGTATPNCDRTCQ